jgi:hypothetical protein
MNVPFVIHCAQTIKRTLRVARVAALMIALCSMLITTSCENYIGGNVNVDPTRPAQVSLASLLPTIQLFTADAQARIGLQTSLWTQQMAMQQAGDDDTHITQGGDWNAAWSSIYLSALTTADRLMTQAGNQQSPYYQAIGKILQAINLGNATGAWENVPFSQAFQGSNNLTPGYDRQQQIYQTINTLLTDALTLLQAPSSNFTPANEDLIYRGDRERWRRLANSLRARYALHLINKGSARAAQDALAAIQAGVLRSNADDCEFSYAQANTVSPIRQQANEVTIGRIFVGIVAVAEYYITRLGASDPRLPLLMRSDRDVPLTTYIGIRSGAGAAATGANAYISPSTWYASNPIQIMNYAEVKFLEAEARFIAAGGTRTSSGAPMEARQALVDAVRANLTKLGVPAAAIDTYLQTIPAATALRLSDIMGEKYKALFLHPEMWVDVRRYDYSPDVFTGLALPQNHNPDLRGRPIQRGIYPTSEQTRNQAVFAQNWQTRPDFLAEKMWRDLP